VVKISNRNLPGNMMSAFCRALSALSSLSCRWKWARATENAKFGKSDKFFETSNSSKNRTNHSYCKSKDTKAIRPHIISLSFVIKLTD
jgi:hypothetical protein